MTHFPDPIFLKDDENRTAVSEGNLFVLPTSFAQQRLWFLDQLQSGSAYIIHRAWRLTGPINAAALEKALNEIVRRHEGLRTTLRSAGGRPVQVIAEKMSLEMPLIDLSGQPKAERELEAERLTRDEAMRRFDLVKGLDDPCDGLDPVNREKILNVIQRIGDGTPTDHIYVTHRETEVPACMTHLMILDKGRVTAQGARKKLSRP